MSRYTLIIGMAFMIQGLCLAQTPLMYEQEALKRLNSKMYHAETDSRTSDYPADFSKNTLAFSDWHYGSINFTDGTSMDSLRFNYDFNAKAVVVQFNLDIRAISLKSDLISSFEFPEGPVNRRFDKKGFEDFEEMDFDMPFFERVYGNDTEAELCILKQYQKELFSAEQQVTYGGEVAEDVYELKERYFIKRAGERLYKKFTLNKKRIIGLIGKAKSKEVLRYARENDLKWNDQFDAAQILRQFLN